MEPLNLLRQNEIINLLAYAKSKKMEIEPLYLMAKKHFDICQIKNNYLDSTGILLKTKLINKLSDVVMNSSYIWAHIEPPKYMASNVSENDKLQLEEQTRVVFDDIQNLSNFELEKTKILDDYLLGTTAFKVEYTGNYENPTRFRHAPIMNVYIVEGADSRINTVFYKNEKMRPQNMRAIWTKGVFTNVIDNQEYDVWECTVYNQAKKNYDYIVALDEGLKDIIYREEQAHTPWIVGRWGPFEHNSPYGAGPKVIAIMELIALRKCKNNLGKIRDYQSDPPLIAHGDRALALSAKFMPGRMAYLGQAENVTNIKPFNNGANPQIEMFDLQEHRELLNEVFYVDAISSIKNIDDLKNVTATAVQVAVTKFAEQIGPVYSRMQKEMLEVIVMKIRNNNLKANIISNKNIEYLKDNTRLTVRYHNAITVAQDQEDIQKNNMFIQDLVSKFGPQVAIAAIKTDEYIKNTADRFGITRKEFNLGEDLIKRLEEMQQSTIPSEQEVQQ